MLHGRILVGRLGCALFMAACGALTAASADAQTASAPAGRPAQAFDIDAYDVDGATLIDQPAIEKAVYPFLGPGRTTADVEAARAALEAAYKAHGYQSVVVEIPYQQVADRVLKLHVVEAPVGRLRVVGSRYVELDKIKKLTPALAEGTTPDFGEAQRQINEINRLPDRVITPVVRPGAVPGTVDIDLKVKDTLPVHASVELDNDHAAQTKPLRVNGSVSYSDLWQLGQTATFGYTTAPERTSDSTVFTGSYLAPLIGSHWSLMASGYYSNSDVATFGGATVLGKGYDLAARAVYQLPSPANTSQSVNFGLDFKHFDELVTVTGKVDSNPVDYVPLYASYSFQYATDTTSADVTLSATAGIRGLGTDAIEFDQKRFLATTNFVHLNLETHYTRSLGHDMSAYLRFEGQFASQPLVSSEQFAAGGMGTVRGYLQSEAVGDDGVIGQFELRGPSLAPILSFVPFINEWRFYGFADAAKLWVIHPLPEQQERFTLYSVGFGSRIELFDHLHGDIAVGWPLRDGTTTDYAHPFATFSVKSEF